MCFYFQFYHQILKSYTLDDCETPIKPAFIEKLTAKLNERPIKVNIAIHHFLFVIYELYQILISNFNFAITDANRYFHDG